MMQTITIQDLACDTIIGIYEHEKHTRQPLMLHLEVLIDAQAVIASGQIEDTLDYDALCKQLLRYLESHSHQLLETLLDGLLEEVAQHSQVAHVTLRIDKPNALKEYGAMVSLSGEWARDESACA